MDNFTNLSLELDQLLVEVYNENLENEKVLEKTDFINAANHKSRVIDLLMEDTIIEFFKEKEYPCIIEAEERGTTILSKIPEYLVIADPLDGTTNFTKRIPLTCYGVAIAKIKKESKCVTFDDIIVAMVRAFHANEFYMANSREGALLNNKPITPSAVNQLDKALIAFDLDGVWYEKKATVQSVFEIFKRCRGTRRFGANLLDMCYVASGKIEVMIDIRERLSAVHAPGLFIAKESGAIISAVSDVIFNPKLNVKEKMSFILCNNQIIMNQIVGILSNI